MVQLKKASNPIFHGNGLGTSTAGWTVKGSEHIAVRQLGTTWVAVDTSKNGAKVAKEKSMNDLRNETDLQLAKIFEAADVLAAAGYGGIPEVDQLVQDAKGEALRRAENAALAAVEDGIDPKAVLGVLTDSLIDLDIYPFDSAAYEEIWDLVEAA